MEGKLKTECYIDFNDPNENRLNIENILVVTHSVVGIYARCYFKSETLDADYSKYKFKNGEVLK